MRALFAIFVLTAALLAQTGTIRGRVTTSGLPVSGATVKASNGAAKSATVTDINGDFSFSNLAAGKWTIAVSMTGFTAGQQSVTIPPGAQDLRLNLSIAPYHGPAPTTATPTSGAQASTSPAIRGSSAVPSQPSSMTGALAINGSMDNAAASPFGLPPAFGNNRRGPMLLYNGDFALAWRNSALDARSFSLTGQNTPRPSYNDVTASLQIGGPLLIPHIFNINNAPMAFLSYQKSYNRNATTAAGLLPTEAERAGDLTALSGPVLTPSQISPQAQALLKLIPQPNLAGNARYNYQTALVTNQHQDGLQARVMKQFAGRDFVSGVFAMQSTRSDTPSLFGFVDTGSNLGLNTNVSWRHGFSQSVWGTFTFDFSRLATRLAPFFASRRNISGAAGIGGNNQSPQDWGPPTLTFAGGFSPLTDGNAMHNRNQTAAFGASFYWNHDDHNFTFGGDFRRLEFNTLQQQNPRGSFLFNGAATGNDFEDFLRGVPDTASLAFGNADKYFRQSSSDLYFSDDWRVGESLTLDLGARWEYSAPITELYGRLVNLDFAPGFTAAAPVVASAASLTGPLSGILYPHSLIRPDYNSIEPRLGLSWRPWSTSSVVIRAGYGMYANTSIYQDLALAMAQQAPLSTSLSLANSSATPLTLANAFQSGTSIGADTFAIDPNFHVGYLQSWDASLQRDLPGSLVMTLTYLGDKGTRAVQRFLPNTYAPGGVNPCSGCPAGFIYMTSNGNSTLESGSARLQRRFHNGFAADVQYTYSHAIDDAQSLGGSSQALGPVAQNWLDLNAERARSDFDQRHKLSIATQYTTGVGFAGGALLRGWQGALYKGWTLTTQITAGSGLPLTPMTLEVIPGTAFTGVRPDVTGAAVTAAPAGLHLNPAAYAPPASGSWGTAGRNSINGPSQFDMEAALQRSFQITGQTNLDFRLDATNVLNHVTFPSWDVIVGSAQFGLPLTANPMRSLRATLRFDF